MEEDELIEKGISLTYDQCETEFSVIKVKEMVETEAFINGDHWQNQNGWVGWVAESKSKSAISTMHFIEKAFNTKNVIGGIIKRLKGAIAGQQPDFAVLPKDGLTPTEAEKAKFAQYDAALNDWFTRKDVHSEIKKFVHNRKAHGKGCLRIHVPIGLFVKDGDSWKVPANSFVSALDFIYVTAHDADKFVEGNDVNFGEKYTVVRLAGNTNPSDMDMPKNQFAVSYVNKDKKTVVRTVNQDNTGDTMELDLGGFPLTIVKGDYNEAIISETIKRMQKAVGCAKTNEILAGNNINFPETTFIDLELPTEAVLQPNGKTKEVEVVPQGMGIWRKLKSRLIQDSDGGDRAVQGQMIQRQQANPEFFAKIANNNTRDMHQEAGMLYIYLADSEYASGDAKIEAMADYLILLVESKTELDTVGSTLGNAVSRLAMHLGNEEQLKDKFTFTYSSKLTLGRLTVEERRLMLDEVKMLLRSTRSYQVNAGISDDPEKENIAIEKEFTALSDDMKVLVYGQLLQQQQQMQINDKNAQDAMKQTQNNPQPPKANGAGS